MDYTITVTEIRSGFRTNVSDADLSGFIAIANTADACLSRKDAPEVIGKQLKRLFVRHMATLQRDGGSVTSERALSGASRSYDAVADGDTGFLDALKQIDTYGCVYALTTNNSPVQLRSIGRRPERASTY